jgi:hypothetical protein
MSFRAAVLHSGTNPQPVGGFFGWGGKRGSSPAPFDAVDPTHLAGRSPCCSCRCGRPGSYLSSSLPSRRETTARPISPSTTR